MKKVLGNTNLFFLFLVSALNLLMLREDFLENPSVLLKSLSALVTLFIYTGLLIDTKSRGIYRHFFAVLFVQTICVISYKYFSQSWFTKSSLFDLLYGITLFIGAPFMYTALLLQTICKIDWKIIIMLLFLLYCVGLIFRVISMSNKNKT